MVDSWLKGLQNRRDQREIRKLFSQELGWAPDELELLATAGFRSLSLGPRILRTDTAALAGAALIMQRWGDLVSPDTRW